MKPKIGYFSIFTAFLSGGLYYFGASAFVVFLALAIFIWSVLRDLAADDPDRLVIKSDASDEERERAATINKELGFDYFEIRQKTNGLGSD